MRGSGPSRNVCRALAVLGKCEGTLPVGALSPEGRGSRELIWSCFRHRAFGWMRAGARRDGQSACMHACLAKRTTGGQDVLVRLAYVAHLLPCRHPLPAQRAAQLTCSLYSCIVRPPAPCGPGFLEEFGAHALHAPAIDHASPTLSMATRSELLRPCRRAHQACCAWVSFWVCAPGSRLSAAGSRLALYISMVKFEESHGMP